MPRCAWCGTDPLYIDYHDREWGVPARDPQVLFEFLLLEAFQAGFPGSPYCASASATGRCCSASMPSAWRA